MHALSLNLTKFLNQSNTLDPRVTNNSTLAMLNKKVYSQGAVRQRNSAMYSANGSFTA